MFGRFINGLVRKKNQKEISAMLDVYSGLLTQLVMARDAGKITNEEALADGGRLGLMVAAITVQRLPPRTVKQRLIANDLEAWFAVSAGLSDINVLQTASGLMSYAYDSGGGDLPVVRDQFDVLDSSLLTECPNYQRFESLRSRLTAG